MNYIQLIKQSLPKPNLKGNPKSRQRPINDTWHCTVVSLERARVSPCEPTWPHRVRSAHFSFPARLGSMKGNPLISRNAAMKSR